MPRAKRIPFTRPSLDSSPSTRRRREHRANSPDCITEPGPSRRPACSFANRLAPSPTGAQHIGNARTYLIAWLSARARGGKVILRMEDIDSPRIKPGAAEEACADLDWLGLDWDEGPFVQTRRLTLYESALEQLK